jgi:hypothetical protein
VLPERLDAVLAVVYLIFNEGWGGGRVDLAAEAIRLGRALVELMLDEAEAVGLLALMSQCGWSGGTIATSPAPTMRSSVPSLKQASPSSTKNSSA